MGFKDILQKIRDRKESKKELFKQMQDQDKLQTLLEERKKSANLRELEYYYKENQEQSIKEQLEIARKEREKDINFNHNPLDTPNITSHTEWEVMKEKNIFKGRGNMFANNENIHKSNPNLLRSGNMLRDRNRLKQRRRIFSIWVTKQY